jgi:CxxC motif-containing protein (DUF1111 family)
LKPVVAVFLSSLLSLAVQAAVPDDFATVVRLGGETTLILRAPSALAFRNPAQNLPDDLVEKHLEGDRLFEMKFSDDPDRGDYGLGPVYNNVSCAACHILDGRGALPVMAPGGQWTKLGLNSAIFLRISLESTAPAKYDATNRWGAPAPVPGYGTQLFHLGSFGVRNDLPGTGQAEVFMKFDYTTFTYPDGTQTQLRRPLFRIENPYDTRLDQPDVRTGARMTPPMIGLGLIEAIRESDILALAARDLSAWGIHGHPNWVIDRAKELAGDPNPISLGRFGLKANTPSVYHQSAGALNGDLGVTSPVFPAESIWGTPLFDAFKPRWKPSVEATQNLTDSLEFYSQTLAVPSRRDVGDPEVRRGGRLFSRVGCANCHQPSFVTGDHKIAALTHQTIYPFTDLLLHDMGPGLADGRRDFQASGSEWRTRALWGIGLTQVVNSRAGFLHDGRAMTLEEAILWHGGEAELSKQKFAHLASAERQALIRFLESL